MIPGLSRALPKDVEIDESELCEDRSDHLLDDAPRAGPSLDSQRFATQADRLGERHASLGRQSSGEAVRRLAADDETDCRWQKGRFRCRLRFPDGMMEING